MYLRERLISLVTGGVESRIGVPRGTVGRKSGNEQCRKTCSTRVSRGNTIFNDFMPAVLLATQSNFFLTAIHNKFLTGVRCEIPPGFGGGVPR